MKKLLLLNILLCTTYHTATAKTRGLKDNEAFCLLLSEYGFKPSMAYNALVHGGSFTFHRIDIDPTDNRGHDFIEQNKLVRFYDGKKSPLILSAIPQQASHIEVLRADYGYQQVDLYTLNRRFERENVGLPKLVAQDPDLFMHLYPTTDYYIPNMVDIVRAVRDLKNRNPETIAVVHCKAGRGRSATMVTAYILTVCYELNIAVTVEQVEAYLKSKRPQVKLGKKIKQLKAFQQLLAQHDSFDELLIQYGEEIKEREYAIEHEGL